MSWKDTIGWGALAAGLFWAMDSAQGAIRKSAKVVRGRDDAPEPDIQEAVLFGFDEPEFTLQGRSGMEGFDDIYQRMARRYSVDWRLLKALAIVESAERPQAVNPADPSMGLMQILCQGPDSDGFCANHFNVDPWPVKKDDLFDPEINVQIGAQIIAWNLSAYGFPKGVAVYNAWSARNDPADGPFRNQEYVDKVLREYGALKEAFPQGGTV